MDLSVGLLSMTAPVERRAALVRFADGAIFYVDLDRREMHQVWWVGEPQAGGEFASLLWWMAGIAWGEASDPPTRATLTMLNNPQAVTQNLAFEPSGWAVTLGCGSEARRVASFADLFAAVTNAPAPVQSNDGPDQHAA